MAHGSFYERWCGIENAWKVFQLHPYFGVGLGGYPSYLYDAFLTGDTRFTVFVSQIAFTDLPNPLKLCEAMNVFTEILASIGIVGALAFIGVIFVFLARAKQALQIDKTFGCSLLLSVIVMVVVLQINQGVFRTYVWVHLALACALVEKIVRDTTPLSVQGLIQEETISAQEQRA